MQSLRDKLLSAGLVSQEQAQKAEADVNRPKKKKRRSRNRPRRPDAAKAEAATKAAVNRMLDLSEPSKLAIAQAIEKHRVRGDTRGEMEFYFQLRDGRVRKMFVTKEVSGGLQSGRLAIVENGELDRHIIVSSEAVSEIRAHDAEVVRFHNSH